VEVFAVRQGAQLYVHQTDTSLPNSFADLARMVINFKINKNLATYCAPTPTAGFLASASKVLLAISSSQYEAAVGNTGTQFKETWFFNFRVNRENQEKATVERQSKRNHNHETVSKSSPLEIGNIVIDEEKK
jgi:hypothetical protein